MQFQTSSQIVSPESYLVVNRPRVQPATDRTCSQHRPSNRTAPSTPMTVQTNTVELDEQDDNQRSGEQTDSERSVPLNRTGLIAGFAGSALLARGLLKFRKSRIRGVVTGAAGVGLLSIAWRKRQNQSGEGLISGDEQAGQRSEDVPQYVDEDETGGIEEGETDPTHRNATDTTDDDENPRDVTTDPDIESQRNEGNVEFSEEQGIESGSGPGDEGASDPRVDEDETPEVDISQAALADEASEATGPSPEQSQPASTEATEPGPSSTDDVESEFEGESRFDGDDADETGSSKHWNTSSTEDDDEEDSEVGVEEEGIARGAEMDASDDDTDDVEADPLEGEGELNEIEDDDDESETADDDY